jgi:Dihydroorotase and related cyclic amidohydrolases
MIDLSQEYTINEADFLSKGTNSPFIGQSVFGKLWALMLMAKQYIQVITRGKNG